MLNYIRREKNIRMAANEWSTCAIYFTFVFPFVSLLLSFSAWLFHSVHLTEEFHFSLYVFCTCTDEFLLVWLFRLKRKIKCFIFNMSHYDWKLPQFFSIVVDADIVTRACVVYVSVVRAHSMIYCRLSPGMPFI